MKVNPSPSLLPTLTLADRDRAAQIGAAAFQNDPLWTYLFPNDDKRAALLARVYRAILTLSIRSGRAYGVGNPLQGYSIWEIPGEKGPSTGVFLGSGFLPLLFSPFLLAVFRAGSIFGRFETMQKRYAPDPHYYLQNISVAPEAQGKGLASALIKPFLARADAEGLSAYTETMTPSNVPLYEHYGFRIMEQYRVPNTDLSIWALYREKRVTPPE